MLKIYMLLIVLGLLGGQGNDEPEFDTNDYVKKTNIERAARSAARQYCPVPPDYDPRKGHVFPG